MSIVSVAETWTGRRGGSDVRKSKREYVRAFVVVTSNTNDGALTVMQAAGVPRQYDIYADANGNTDLGSYCRTVKPEQQADNPFAWKVLCEYSSELDDPQLSKPNPLDRRTELSITFQQFQKAIETDIEGFTIVNSAGDAPDPPVEVDDSRPVLTFKRNEAAFDLGLAVLYKDAISSDVFLGIAAGLVKLQSLTSKQSYENGILYYETTYEFHVRPEGWDFRLLDRGYRQFNAAFEPVAIVDKFQRPYSTPQLLDGNGKLLAPGGTPVYRNYKPYKRLPFAIFNLP